MTRFSLTSEKANGKAPAVIVVRWFGKKGRSWWWNGHLKMRGVNIDMWILWHICLSIHKTLPVNSQCEYYQKWRSQQKKLPIMHTNVRSRAWKNTNIGTSSNLHPIPNEAYSYGIILDAYFLPRNFLWIHWTHFDGCQQKRPKPLSRFEASGQP